jgi:3-oxoadipate enol-lactonase
LFARDLVELLDHVGWPSATVAGCSMGGCVALAFAGLYPARATRLGLIDTTASYTPQAAAQFRERVAAAGTKGMAGLVDFQVTRWFSDEFRASQPKLVNRATEGSLRGLDEAFRQRRVRVHGERQILGRGTKLDC